MSNIVLSCKGLKKTYNDGHSFIHVLQHVDLDVHAGQLIAIVGNSGSGKSTLLHLLGGLDKPSAGKVSIANKDLATLSENEKCYLRNHSLGFVYQFHHLLPEFTAIENVCMPLLIQNVTPAIATEKAEHLLNQVGLKNRLHHKIGELSGGERQRVAIARALVANPLCVLADEPTGNLDPRNAEKVLELFFELQKNYHTSVVMVTHDHTIAARAERLYTLEEGYLK
jgi:lipoprotein-releasing system ATP-binding protein